MLVNFFFCYISFIGFVNVKGKGLVRLREAIKKNYQTLDIVQTWGGVSGPAKLFFEKRYGHVLRGEGVKGPRPK